MSIRTITVKMFRCMCEYCGHKWDTRKEPRCCAKCKTPYWNKKKKNIEAIA